MTKAERDKYPSHRYCKENCKKREPHCEHLVLYKYFNKQHQSKETPASTKKVIKNPGTKNCYLTL